MNAASTPDSEPNPNSGHRERLRGRVWQPPKRMAHPALELVELLAPGGDPVRKVANPIQRP